MTTTATNPYAATDSELTRPASGYNECAIWGIKQNRIGRFRLLTRWLLSTLTLYAGAALAGGIGAAIGGVVGGILGFVAIIVGLGFLVYYFMTLVQRFHDMGKSGWFSLLTIIPLVIIWPMAAKGDEGVNDYGNPPPPNTTLNKVCGWLYIGLIVVGVVAVFMLPAMIMSGFNMAP